MPVGPDVAITTLKENLTKVMAEIDDKLSSPKFITNDKSDIGEYYSYLFIFNGSVSQQEKLYIIDSYIKAGWSKVEIKNGSEVGDRDNVFNVQLYIDKNKVL